MSHIDLSSTSSLISTSTVTPSQSSTVKRVKRIEKAFTSTSEPVKKAKTSVLSIEEKADDSLNEITQFTAAFSIATKVEDGVDIQVKRKTAHEHVLSRPDTYVGSTEFEDNVVYTLVERTFTSTTSTTKPTEQPEEDEMDTEEEVNQEEAETPRIVTKLGIGKALVRVNEALMRIFIEVLSNAIDNVWQSVRTGITPKYIKVNVTKTGLKVWNDGRNIPTGLNEAEKMHTPELIFGNMFTSTNYNDEEERMTSGRNGLGVKLTNIFSKLFKVTVFNKDEKCLYTQEWRNNMFSRYNPVLKNKGFPTSLIEGRNGFTCVEWQPDFARFGCEELSDDMINLIKKYVYDAAMIVSINKVQVLFNDQPIAIHKMTDYINLYFDAPPKQLISLQTEDSFVFLAPSFSHEWTPVAFTNGVFNKNGGIHVEKWSEALLRPLVSKIAEKHKSIDLREVKKHFFLFVCCFVKNPKFDDQPKHKLVKPAPTVNVPTTVIPKLLKWPFVKQIEDSIKLKDTLTFTKETSGKNRKLGRVPKLEDANLAGKGKKDCVLCITEGDSAATYVTKGMKYGFTIGSQQFKGRDTIGVYPIRGKFVNVKNASSSTLSKNAELVGICKAVGLVYGVDYTDDANFNKLRYKRICLNSDSDDDGFHITGLLYNLFHTLFPSLLKRPGFFCFMRTPIIKVTQPKAGTKPVKPLNFYYQEQARQYLEEHKVASNRVKYLKGLGTSNDQDIAEDFGKRIVNLLLDDKGNQMMENIFGGSETGFRKQWILNHEPRTVFPAIVDGQVENLPVTDFLNLEMINYSVDHCRRAIPSIVDGLKDSTRKILYGAFKRNLKYSGESFKVAQFANYVAETSNYHHGEMILFDTITRMAQRFVGSNNLPLLFNDGQFGSRKHNGDDAANGRYIKTKLDMCTEYIFRREDEPTLRKRIDDGDEIEPEVYAPIVPMILVNGCVGSIGTGFSSTIPPYNIKDIVAWIKAWLTSTSTPVLIPYYRGFLGEVKVEDGKVITVGIVKEVESTIKREAHKRWVVSEIPIGKRMVSISKFTTKLEELEDDNKIRSLDNQSSENQVSLNFLPVDTFAITSESLGLVDSTSTTNMVMYSTQNKIKRYNSIDEIMTEWCEYRFEQYNIRKAHQLVQLEKDAKVLYNKVRFIEMVLSNKLQLQGKDEETLAAELTKLKFDLVDSTYDYILTIQVRHMTSKRLFDLQKQYSDILALIKSLSASKIQDIWCKELDELMNVYSKWEVLQK